MAPLTPRKHESDQDPYIQAYNNKKDQKGIVRGIKIWGFLSCEMCWVFYG